MPVTTLNAQLWPVLDRLRDAGMAVHDVAPQVATLLYLRWVDFQDAESEAIAAFDESDFQPLLPTALHWRTWHALRPEDLQECLAKRLPQAMANLVNQRHDPRSTRLHWFSGILEGFAQWQPQSIASVVAWLASQPFETLSDRRRLLTALDDLLAKRIEGGRGHTEFVSPLWLSTLVAGLARPSAGIRMYDPCFGSAGFLVACCWLVQAQEGDGFRRQALPPLSIHGGEVNASAFAIGLTRLALAGVEDPQLELGNSLERDATSNPTRDGFDLVVANPPWGMRVDRFGADHYPIKTTDSTGLFIQHALANLRPDGRAVIVVPQGLLFRGGADQRLREWLVTQHSVEAVIALPTGSFKPYTSIAAAVLVLRRKGPTERICMADASVIWTSNSKSDLSFGEQIQAFAKRIIENQESADTWFVTAKEVAEAEWDLTPKRRDQSGLDSLLEDLRSQVPVQRLDECCEIMSGHGIKSADLADEPYSPTENEIIKLDADFTVLPNESGANKYLDPIPYIRIGDIRKGVVGKGAKWLGPQILRSLDPRWKLRAGDVLVSKSGTIGKAGVVRNGAIGGVAANGLFVLHPADGRLDPHYLNAYFASGECQAWLQARTRGSVMNHLPKQVLAEMPIVLPPLPVQQRAADQHREHGVDVLAYLSQLLLEGENDPIIAWMDQALAYLKSEAAGKLHELAPLLHAHVFGTSLTNVRNQVAHSTTHNALSAWILILNQVVTPALRDCTNVPQGPSLYALLQQADQGLQQAQTAIEGHLPHANRARDLTSLIKERIKAAIGLMLDQVKIGFVAETNQITAESVFELSVTISNEGTLPIRNFGYRAYPIDPTGPEWDMSETGYLREGGSVKSVLMSTAPNVAHLLVRYEWHGVRIDGVAVDGRSELPFVVVESIRQQTEDLGASPYVTGDPLTPIRADVFVGRDEKLEQIRRQISTTGNVVLLEGNRRAGKTSILKHLEGANKVPGWLGVYISLQGAEGSRAGVGVPTDEIFRAFAREIAKAVHMLGSDTPLPNGSVLAAGSKPMSVVKACREGISTTAPFTDFQAYIEVILEALERHSLGLILMLDEFDKLQEGIDNGVTSPQVPENIRFLVQRYPRCSAILTGSRRLQRMREEYWSALYGLGTRIGVTALDPKAAERLIIDPVKGRLNYSTEAIQRMILLTAGQPYLLQCLCNRIFDLAAQSKVRAITLDQVDRASIALIEENEHFASLWDYAGGRDHPQRRRYLLCLCHREGDGPNPLHLGAIQEHLSSDGIEADDEAVASDLNHLRELELIDLVGDGTMALYRLSIPLMGIWIDRERDIAATLAAARTESEDSNAG